MFIEGRFTCSLEVKRQCPVFFSFFSPVSVYNFQNVPKLQRAITLSKIQFYLAPSQLTHFQCNLVHEQTTTLPLLDALKII